MTIWVSPDAKIYSTRNMQIFYVSLTVHPNEMIVFFYKLEALILYFSTFTLFLYMFRALLRSSSGGKLY